MGGHTDLEITELGPSDHGAAIDLWEAAGLPARPNGRDSFTEFVRQLGFEGSVYLKAEIAGHMVGVLLGTHDGRKGWVNRLAVAPEHRDKGVATALVREFEDRLASVGIGVWAALVEGWNEGSRAFFERIGYTCHDDITYYTRRVSEDV